MHAQFKLIDEGGLWIQIPTMAMVLGVPFWRIVSTGRFWPSVLRIAAPNFSGGSELQPRLIVNRIRIKGQDRAGKMALRVRKMMVERRQATRRGDHTPSTAIWNSTLAPSLV